MTKELLTDDGDATEEFYAVMEEVFSRFDADKNGTLSKGELDEFAKACNGEPFEEGEHEEMAEYFEVNEENGELTFRGFSSMWLMQTDSEEEVTWKDLEKLGYDKDLKLSGKASEENEEAKVVEEK